MCPYAIPPSWFSLQQASISSVSKPVSCVPSSDKRLMELWMRYPHHMFASMLKWVCLQFIYYRTWTRVLETKCRWWKFKDCNKDDYRNCNFLHVLANVFMYGRNIGFLILKLLPFKRDLFHFTWRGRKRARCCICYFTPQTASVTRLVLGLSETVGQELSPGLPSKPRPKALGHSLLPSQVIGRELWSEVEHLGLKPAPIWGASATGCGLM